VNESYPRIPPVSQQVKNIFVENEKQQNRMRSFKGVVQGRIVFQTQVSP
jgi:hypothetical protein